MLVPGIAAEVDAVVLEETTELDSGTEGVDVGV